MYNILEKSIYFVLRKYFLFIERLIYIYIYMYVLFGPVKQELGVIPSGQENYSKVNILVKSSM